MNTLDIDFENMTERKGHQAYKLTYNGLHEACANDIELRSIVK